MYTYVEIAMAVTVNFWLTTRYKLTETVEPDLCNFSLSMELFLN